ncbi:MAG: hypothetical protein K9M57_10145 [Phycisphaerae bacterium]|nr:hypothetical protein [Phycisphaerae bacterium]
MTDKNRVEQIRTAKHLLNISNRRSRIKVIIKYLLIFVVCFIGNTLSYKWDSPLSLLPEMFSACLMGMIILLIKSTVKFPLLEKYIDWDEVQKDAHANSESYQVEAELRGKE